MSTSFARRALALAAVAALAPASSAQHRPWTETRVETCSSVCSWPVFPAAWEPYFVGWHVRSTHVASFDFLVRNNLTLPWYGGFVGELLEHFGDLGALHGAGTAGCIWGLDGRPVFALNGPWVLQPGDVGAYTAFTQRVTVFPNAACSELFGPLGDVYRWADTSSLSTNAYAYVPALSVLNRSTLERRHEFSFDFRLPRLSPCGDPCSSARNSTGARGELDGYGSDVATDGLLVLVASSVPNGAVGYFLMSATAVSSPPTRGGLGTLCLGAPLLRLGSTVGVVAGFEHAARVDFRGLPGGAAITAGSTWHFQFWHRDADQAPTHNTTERLSLTFS